MPVVEVVLPGALVGVALIGLLVWRHWAPLHAVLAGAGLALVLGAYRAALDPAQPAAEALVLFAALGGSIATIAAERHRAQVKSQSDASGRTA